MARGIAHRCVFKGFVITKPRFAVALLVSLAMVAALSLYVSAPLGLGLFAVALVAAGLGVRVLGHLTLAEYVEHMAALGHPLPEGRAHERG
jgi:hypothetical protein